MDESQEAKNMVSLSFHVKEIIERDMGNGVVVYDTKLRDYCTNEIITVRGRPWRVGSKVDFLELKEN
jgi:hypothetical protein